MATQISRRDVMKSIGIGAAALALAGTANCQTEKPAPPPGAYVLPELPYAYGALAPALAEEVLRVHHEKHHAGYVKGLNDTLDKLAAARSAGNMADVKALSRDLAFNGSGHVLHTLYWTSMTPGGSGEPTGELAKMLARDFGSLAAFKAQFLAATKSVEASGWGILAYEPMGRRLVVLQSEKHQDLTIWGAVPLMVCDVWEHAYYVQYQNRRADYVDAFWGLVDWPSTEKRLQAALA